MKIDIYENYCRIKYLFSDLERTMDDIRDIVKHCAMIQNQLDQMMQTQKTLLHDMSLSTNKPKVNGVGTSGGASNQDPLYPEGHPQRVEHDTKILMGMPQVHLKRKRREL